MKKLSYDILSLKEQMNISTQWNNSDNSADFKKLKENLIKIIQNELTPRQRQIINLYYYHNLTTIEIAKILKINKSTVSKTKKLAIQNIKRFLQYYFN